MVQLFLLAILKKSTIIESFIKCVGRHQRLQNLSKLDLLQGQKILQGNSKYFHQAPGSVMESHIVPGKYSPLLAKTKKSVLEMLIVAFKGPRV